MILHASLSASAVQPEVFRPIGHFSRLYRPISGMAFVFIAHLNPNEKIWLTEILSRSTQMPVLQAAESMPIQANHVYVIPPNANLLVERLAFKVVSPRTMHEGRHQQVDLFLMSLAEAIGSRAVGVIFSGGDGDGTEGCQRIKAKGGRTFAQDLSAEVDSMPLNAIASGCVDAVLSPIELSDELVRMAASASSSRVLGQRAVRPGRRRD